MSDRLCVTSVRPQAPYRLSAWVLLTQLFPGRPPVRKLLGTLQEWLATLPLDRIPYNAVLDLVNNKMRVSPAPRASAPMLGIECGGTGSSNSPLSCCRGLEPSGCASHALTSGLFSALWYSGALGHSSPW